MENLDDYIKECDKAIREHRKFSDRVRNVEYELISDKESLMRQNENQEPPDKEKITEKIRRVRLGMQLYKECIVGTHPSVSTSITARENEMTAIEMNFEVPPEMDATSVTLADLMMIESATTSDAVERPDDEMITDAATEQNTENTGRDERAEDFVSAAEVEVDESAHFREETSSPNEDTAAFEKVDEATNSNEDDEASNSGEETEPSNGEEIDDAVSLEDITETSNNGKETLATAEEVEEASVTRAEIGKNGAPVTENVESPAPIKEAEAHDEDEVDDTVSMEEPVGFSKDSSPGLEMYADEMPGWEPISFQALSDTDAINNDQVDQSMELASLPKTPTNDAEMDNGESDCSIIWIDEPSLCRPKSSQMKLEPRESRRNSSRKDYRVNRPSSTKKSRNSMPRQIESSDEEVENGALSEGSVVDDEDLELEQAIRDEKAKNRKKNEPRKNGRKKSCKISQEDEDELDQLIKEGEAALKTPRKRKTAKNGENEAKQTATSSKNGKSSTPKEEVSSSEDEVFSKNRNRNKLAFGEDDSDEDSPVKSRRKKPVNDTDEDPTDQSGEEEEDSHVPMKKRRLGNKELEKTLREAERLLASDNDGEEEKVTKKRVTRGRPSKRRPAISSDSEDKQSKSTESDTSDSSSENGILIRKKATVSSDEEEEEETVETNEKSPKKKGTGAVKKIMTRDKLQQETIDAEKAEKERRKRLEQKQKEFNGIEMAEGVNLETALTGSQSTPKLKSVVLDPDQESEPPVPVAVHSELVAILKPHQAKGIQFMYDSTFESIERLEEDGGGGILAHCMGLGKTLQVITFLHTVMTHSKLREKSRRALVVVPKNVVINWFKEFRKWLERDQSTIGGDLQILELDSVKRNEDRIHVLKNWFKTKDPCVLIIGYDMFRILVHDEEDMKKKRGQPKKKAAPTKKQKKFDKLKDEFRQYLQDPGPDIVICDEAHKLKNDESALSKAMVKIRTKRRICLTGTPLQNNLMEYHCMVNFVKPGLLGTKTEFANRFSNIIQRGRTKDATINEVRHMKRRCHVLFEYLKKSVDRKDYTVLKEAIPPKQEYVINVRMTDRQCKLYRAFLENVVEEGQQTLQKRLLADYHVLNRVWTHPYQLVLHEQKLERERMMNDDAQDFANFVVEDDDSGSGSGSDSEIEILSDRDSDIVAVESDEDGVRKNRKTKADTAPRKSRRLEGELPEMEGRDVETPPEYSGWFTNSGLVNIEDQEDWSLSNKLVLLAAILKKCEEIGDKMLVFSQSLESLALIRRMLEYFDTTRTWYSDGHEACKAAGETWGWKEGRDYMVIDGSVQSGKRDAVQTKFNNPANLRARLMLISTRAGSLGTNMVAANRVVIFDACWNPSHDTQSLFRVYRFGQTKPVYIYRFIAQGTMEERIYKRQVTKESTSMRVVDEAQIQRHYEGHDLDELYKFDPNELDKNSADSRPAFAPPKDRLLADVLLSNTDAVVNYFQHDTLFAQVDDEKLTEEELKDAWDEYEREKTNPRAAFTQANYNNIVMQQHLARQNVALQSANSIVQLRAQLARDPVFLGMFSVPGMDDQTALAVTYLKQTLETILPKIPMGMRGGINEFNSFFLNFITQATTHKHNPQWLLNKSLSTFRTVIKLVKDVADCKDMLREIYKQTPQYFDPMEPPPV